MDIDLEYHHNCIESDSCKKIIAEEYVFSIPLLS